MDNSYNNDNYYARMKSAYSGITNTSLWKYLENDENGRNYAIDISRLCFDACVASETITELLPNFTKHDHTHIKSVLEWMDKLLDGKLEKLKIEEVAMLIMIACCHDVGMCISKSEKDDLKEELQTGYLDEDLKKYFKKNADIEEKYLNRDIQQDNSDLYDSIIRDYVRVNHHLRVEEVLDDESFSGLKGPLRKDLIIDLCRSHGESLSSIKILTDETGVRIYLLAILLRLADILNFDISRSPNIKFKLSGLENPQSKEEKISAAEHVKNQICDWDINGNMVVCTGVCPDAQNRHDILNYIEWVRKEVNNSNELLNVMNSSDNPLIIKQVKPALSGNFVLKDFNLKINAKKIINLLGSENVYGDKRAYLTELIQNSVDAIQVRTSIQNGFNNTNGRIDIYLWEDDKYLYTRIDDNGCGMDENIINNYFLNVGESYYTSWDFNRIMREGQKSFVPINRFGIGILSCFMNKTDVRMEIETKSINDGNVYRMDITSLEGYYSLYKVVSRTKDYLPMSAPSFANIIRGGYIRDYGTSICVIQTKDESLSVNLLRSFLEGKVVFPIVTTVIHTPDFQWEITKKDEFFDSIEKIMKGHKYRNFNDCFDVYYLNSLEDYLTPQNYEQALNDNKLKDVELIVVTPTRKFLSKVGDEIPVRTGLVEFISSWLDQMQLTDEERLFVKKVLYDFIIPYGNLYYNGLVFPLNDTYSVHASYCFVNGYWLDKVTLSKSELLGSFREIVYLKTLNILLCDNKFVNDAIPNELFEIVEQKLMYYRDFGETGKVTFSFSKAFDYSYYTELRALSYIYNIHFKFDEETGSISDAYFSREDHISSEESKFRFRFFENPICAFEDDIWLLGCNGFINYKHPLVKWILKNHIELSDLIIETYESFRSLFNSVNSVDNVDLSEQIYQYLQLLLDNGCKCFDNEITDYMKALKIKPLAIIRRDSRLPNNMYNSLRKTHSIFDEDL